MADIVQHIPEQSSQESKGEIKKTTITPVVNLSKSSSSSRIEYLKEQHRHESEMARYGWFGKIFGTEENSSKTITFVLLVIILFMWFAICVISIWFPLIKFPAKEIFEILIPLITLAFGYFFGKK